MRIKEKLFRKLSGCFHTSFPREFQIQTISGCNARCVFCSYSNISRHVPHGRMDENVFKKIIDEAIPSRPKKIKPYLMNEPLLDKRLPSLIKYVSEHKNTDTLTEIYTNAGLLTEQMSDELIESGLDRMIVSFQGIDAELYEKTMVGLKHDIVLKNLKTFIRIRDQKRSPKPYFEIRMINTGFSHRKIADHKKFWNDHGVRLMVKPLENLGSTKIEATGLELKRWQNRSFCRRPFSYAWVLFNGDFVLCCNDWEQKHILGNIQKNTIIEIWKSKNYIEIRRKFITGDVSDTICGSCKNDGYILS